MSKGKASSVVKKPAPTPKGGNTGSTGTRGAAGPTKK